MVNTFYQYAREHLSNSRERAFAAVALASRELYKGYSETKKGKRDIQGIFWEKKEIFWAEAKDSRAIVDLKD